MSAVTIRRPRVIEPRCLRCRHPLTSNGEYHDDPRCRRCGATFVWSGAVEGDDA